MIDRHFWFDRVVDSSIGFGAGLIIAVVDYLMHESIGSSLVLLGCAVLIGLTIVPGIRSWTRSRWLDPPQARRR